MAATTTFDRWATKIVGAITSWEGLSMNLRSGNDAGSMRGGAAVLSDYFEQLCREMDLVGAARQFEFIRDDLRNGAPDLADNEKLADRIDLAVRSFKRDLQDRYFHRIAAAKQEFHSADFGPTVTKAFKDAAYDAGEANTCYALDRNTAAVFHAMRCVEVGLRALARERGITRTKKGPLEWLEWRDIIKEIGLAAENEGQKWPRGPHKDAFFDFYRGALREFEGFKDEFRNHVSHMRGSYGEAKALKVVVSVRDFMQRLAAGGLEQSGKRIRWRKK